MKGKPSFGPLTFGFDIGIASVGWAVFAPTFIVDLGVRAFNKAETAKDGEPLNLARRLARLARRRLRRRAWRLTKLGRLLKRHGLIAEAKQLQRQTALPKTPWQFRVAGLDRLLGHEEWARVLYHLCKHRGFHWISRAEEKKADSDNEGGRVKKGLLGTRRLMLEKQYRSAAEMVLAEFPKAQRNKRGEYDKALSRVLLADELALLFKQQRSLGNPHATAELESAVLGTGDRKSGLFWEQKPPLSGADLLKMLGKCTFEKDEFRAPKASFTAERHVWLTRLNNLRIVVDGQSRPLNEVERQVVLPLPYQQAGDLTYKQVRSALIKASLLPDHFKFASLTYPTQDSGKDPEAERLVKVPAWQELRKTLTDKGLATEWRSIAGAATGGNPEQLDQIARVLSVFKDGDEVDRELRMLNLPGGEAMITALGEVSFDKFHALSLKALRRIVPYMESGMRYDEAVKQIPEYGHHSQLFKSGKGQEEYLPPLYTTRDRDGRMVLREDADIPRNPVVLRSLNQARKVMNALVRRYGSPSAVHIEMARDLSRPMDERTKIKKAQDEYRERNEKAKADFETEFGMQARSREFEKFQLYREQQGKCAYSVRPLDLDRVLHDRGYAEVDHALPYSRSFDDSKNNKVLVLSAENRDKGNRTPYEYLTSFAGGENGDRWRNYLAYVQGNKSFRLAKRNRLLRKNFDKDEAKEFAARNLNDTRYVCKFFKNYVEQHLKFAEGSDSKRCVVLSGQLTAFLRTRWGFNKVRGDSDRHHALDAAVVAACSHALVKRLSDYSRRKELEHASDVVDMETGEIRDPRLLAQLEQDFPKPWANFRDELLLRLSTDNPALLRAEAQRLGYLKEALDLLRPLFVSRAPQRRNGGAAHMDTIYAKPRPGQTLMVEVKTKEGKQRQSASPQELATLAIERVGVFDTADKGRKYRLTADRLDDAIDARRNARQLHALRLWLAQRADNPKQPGTKDLPRKPLKDDPENGPFSGPEIKAVKLNAGKTSGVELRGGIAKNDTMLRVDVFVKDGKFHLVPVYVHHRVTGLPNRAIVAHKDEAEWPEVDDSYEFAFSIYPNDLLRIRQKKEAFIGYYAGCDRGSGNVNLWVHDRNSSVGKDGLMRGIGVKTAVQVERLHVDTLGQVYPAPREPRRGLA